MQEIKQQLRNQLASHYNPRIQLPRPVEFLLEFCQREEEPLQELETLANSQKKLSSSGSVCALADGNWGGGDVGRGSVYVTVQSL
jgi:hypothetical protein